MGDRRLEMKSFEDLEVWQQARKLVSAVYQMTSNDKLARDYGLCGQLQRKLYMHKDVKITGKLITGLIQSTQRRKNG